MVSSQFQYTKRNRFMPFLLAEILNFQGSTHRIGVGSFSKKLFKYRTAGVREYWVVDPDKNLILVYNFEQGTSEQYTLSDKVKAGIYENLVIDFRNIRL